MLHLLDSLETLLQVQAHETMTRAATALRVSQSTVSKRLAALETALGYPLLERQGRRVHLTAAARGLLEETAPLLAALRTALEGEPPSGSGRLRLGVSESVLASWGPAALARVQSRMPALELELHAHRSPVAIDHVRAGVYAAALVAGRHDRMPDLLATPLWEEEMVVIPSGGGRLRARRGSTVEVLTIETHAATWAAIRGGLARLQREKGIRVQVLQRLESFSAIAQMARSGLGNGLVPLGTARAMGCEEGALYRFPGRGLRRPISLLGRPTTFQRPLASAFRDALVAVLSPTEAPAPAAPRRGGPSARSGPGR